MIVDLALLYNTIIIDEDVADADNDYGGWVASDDHELYSKKCNSEHVPQSSWHVHPLRGLRAAPLSAIILSVRVTQHRLSTGLRRTGEAGAMAVFSALHLLFLLQLVTSALAQVRDAGRSTINRPLLLIAWDLHIHI